MTRLSLAMVIIFCCNLVLVVISLLFVATVGTVLYNLVVVPAIPSWEAIVVAGSTLALGLTNLFVGVLVMINSTSAKA